MSCANADAVSTAKHRAKTKTKTFFIICFPFLTRAIAGCEPSELFTFIGSNTSVLEIVLLASLFRFQSQAWADLKLHFWITPAAQQPAQIRFRGLLSNDGAMLTLAYSG